ncbi:MAG TPA: peptidoglycan-binding protein [Polyangiaceae bacterium]|nr:peptidoglycan-binding protein [Polyangiaceae bacterium]
MPSLYTVSPGDCLYRIAQANGFASWETIYDDPGNQDFKKARPDPNVIYPGDELVLPDVQPSTKSVSCPTDKTHKFQIKLQRILFRVKVKDENDAPIAGKKFRLDVAGSRFSGTTDGDGIVEQRIPVDATSARLWVFFSADLEDGEYLMWDVGVGYLDPTDTPEGVQERLNNLGFVCGDPDGQWHDGMDVAVRTFQTVAGIDASGTVDDGTVSKLKEVHGKV